MKITSKITIAIVAMFASCQLVLAQNASNFIETNSNAGFIVAGILVMFLLLLALFKNYLNNNAAKAEQQLQMA